MHDWFAITNIGVQAVVLPLRLRLRGGFEDVFTIRGLMPEHTGRRHQPHRDGAGLRFEYDGSDGMHREVTVRFSEPPHRLEGDVIRWRLALQPGETHEMLVSFAMREHSTADRPAPLPELLGVGLPARAAQTLRLLARFQGTRFAEWTEEQPGRLLHELCTGELARSGEIPHTPYYGSADAIPLFVMLVAAHARWTGTFELFHELEDHVERALEWIDRFGRRIGDAFIAYESMRRDGLENQGWKDSGDARQCRWRYGKSTDRAGPSPVLRVRRRLGRAHDLGRRAALQPDRLSPRLRMATRQWADRRGVQTLRSRSLRPRLAAAMFDAASYSTMGRLSELFAGFGRDEYPMPVRYPVACHPQAWAAGTIPHLVQTTL